MPLTRTRVIRAAMELMERDTEDPIPMGALATHLGCSLMALYGCVPSTAALLDGIARAALSAFPADAPDADRPWCDQLAAQARALRQTARARPRSVILAASRPPDPAPPGWPLEQALAPLRAFGLPDEDSARVVRALAWYVLGSLLTQPDEDADADFDFGLALLLAGAAALPGAAGYDTV
jgi:AcrR family transcriptional regulator